jgi:ketosteroid isomerase-like protein
MSQENVEVVQAAYDAWNAGDMDALGELYDAEAVTRPLESWPEQATAVGREAVMRVWKQLRETFDADAAETVSVVEVGDRVAVRTIWHGTGHGPEAAFEMTMIYTVRNRRIFYLESFWDHAEALETLGLSVEEMSKENVEVSDSFTRRSTRTRWTWTFGTQTPNCDPPLLVGDSLKVPFIAGTRASPSLLPCRAKRGRA